MTIMKYNGMREYKVCTVCVPCTTQLEILYKRNLLSLQVYVNFECFIIYLSFCCLILNTTVTTNPLLLTRHTLLNTL